MKAILGIESLGTDGLRRLLDRAGWYAGALAAGERLHPTLAGTVVGTLFFEPSTRTRISFEVAARRLGADVASFDPDQSSMSKGETLQDTVLTVSAIGMDVLVVRHGEAGVPERIHRWTGRPVINAGDGTGEHPTQALADCLTLTRRFGAIAGLRVAIVGDVIHSRVAGSLLLALPALGAEVVLVGPGTLLPESRFRSTDDLDSVLDEVDVVYLLRIQRERGAEGGSGYEEMFRLDEPRAARMRPEAVVMHPGPINRGVEIGSGVADGARSLILTQVANGVPARMAALEQVLGVLP